MRGVWSRGIVRLGRGDPCSCSAPKRAQSSGRGRTDTRENQGKSALVSSTPTARIFLRQNDGGRTIPKSLALAGCIGVSDPDATACEEGSFCDILGQLPQHGDGLEAEDGASAELPDGSYERWLAFRCDDRR